MARQQRNHGRKALDLLEEAVHLLRRLPVSAWLIYAVGTLPFVIAVAFFWADMSRSGTAGVRLAPMAFLLAILFVWMKLFQSFFVSCLKACHMGDAPPRWSPAAIFRVIRLACIWHGPGLAVLFLAANLLVPFPLVYAYFQNLTVLPGPEREAPEKGYFRQAIPVSPGAFFSRQVSLQMLLGLVSLVLFLSWMIVLIATPELVRIFTGWESRFTQNDFAFLNTTFLAICAMLTFVAFDPLVKAVYLLDYHYLIARQTGEDLRLDLKRAQRARTLSKDTPTRGKPGRTLVAGSKVALFLLVAAAASFSSPDARATETAVDPDDLSRSISDTLLEPEYSWRKPVEGVEEVEQAQSWLSRQFEAFFDWLADLFESEPREKSPSGDTTMGAALAGLAQMLMFVLVVIIAVVVVALIIRTIMRVRKEGDAGDALEASGEDVVAPDVADETTTADQLPSSGWMRLAIELRDKGDYRLAIRALYLAQLASLADAGLIFYQRFKTNHDYASELSRRAHVYPTLPPLFGQNTRVFDAVWYGEHAATREAVDQMIDHVSQMETREAAA